MKIISCSVNKTDVLKHLLLLSCMLLLNGALPYGEPLSFGLFFAALSCGFHPLLCGAEYLLSSVLSLSWEASLSAAVQASFLLLVHYLYRKQGKVPKGEKFAYAALAQLPFIFLFPHSGYAFLPLAPIFQKSIFALVITLFTLLADGALYALRYRALRCRLLAHQLTEICLVWTLVGMGAVRLLGTLPYFVFCVCTLFFAVAVLQNSTTVPFALVLAIPLAIMQRSLLPLALFPLFTCLPLLFVQYGKSVSAVTLFSCLLVTEYFYGLFALAPWQIAVRLVLYALPLTVLCLLPQKVYKRLSTSLLFYRERTLPRVAINRNRRAVGEQLYEVSALFREIGNTFLVEQGEESVLPRLRDQLVANLCKGCKNKANCERTGVYEHLEKLVRVGCTKGKVSLVDLPEKLASSCHNSAGMLFALNERLTEYRRYAYERQTAQAGRTLLGEQSLGVSEILKNIALEQSEEFRFSHEERTLSRALAQAGVLSSEIFLYGEGSDLTVSLTANEKTGAKRLCAAASAALGLTLTLADKIPLTASEACFILRRKATFDAAFGIAQRSKQTSAYCGDTHSILKIDERRFLVALSDGMGSGERAREVSDRTLNLLESFYKCKMPSDIILSTVNKLLSFTADETFSCLDLACVDLDSGVADIVKIGSPVGFVLSEDKLNVLEGQSLPMGVLESVTPVTMRTQLCENDFLIFMSDGVTQAFGSSAELYGYLSELRPINPQALAEDILSVALDKYKGCTEDDMTVLAVKLSAA